VSSFSVVPNSVTGTHADPLRDWAVLLLLFAQDFLNLKRLLGRLLLHILKREKCTV